MKTVCLFQLNFYGQFLFRSLTVPCRSGPFVLTVPDKQSIVSVRWYLRTQVWVKHFRNIPGFFAASGPRSEFFNWGLFLAKFFLCPPRCCSPASGCLWGPAALTALTGSVGGSSGSGTAGAGARWPPSRAKPDVSRTLRPRSWWSSSLRQWSSSCDHRAPGKKFIRMNVSVSNSDGLDLAWQTSLVASRRLCLVC